MKIAVGHSVIHILHHGRPLCCFSSAVPSDWPPGHLWVGLYAEKSVSTCPDCKAEKARISAPTPGAT